MSHGPCSARRFARLIAALALLTIGLGAGSCARPAARSRLASLDPNERSRAVIDMARSGDPQYLPDLVECLEDEDAAVRFYSILALERMTGTRLGYSYAAGPAQRRAAYHAWRVYLTELEGASEHAASESTLQAAPEAAAAEPGSAEVPDAAQGG